MKKILTIIVSTALVGALFVGCGAKNTGSTANTGSSTSTENTSSTESTGLKDGTYKADTGKFDDHGWKQAIEITVKDGKITDVVYDEYNKDDNHKKSEDAAYKESYAKQVSGADPKVTYEKLAKSLIEKQDPEKVDAVAGATSSTNSFKEVAKKALEQAK